MFERLNIAAHSPFSSPQYRNQTEWVLITWEIACALFEQLEECIVTLNLDIKISCFLLKYEDGINEVLYYVQGNFLLVILWFAHFVRCIIPEKSNSMQSSLVRYRNVSALRKSVDSLLQRCFCFLLVCVFCFFCCVLVFFCF